MGDTAKRVGKSIQAVAEAGVEGLTGTVDALLGAVTDVIAPATMEAVDEMKQMFPDPNNPPKDSAPYLESLKIAAKTGAAGVAGTVLGCASAVTDAIIPAAVKGAEGVKNAFAKPDKSEEH